MNEIRDILIGIDFGRKESQISYYDRKAEEPLSVSMKVGTSQYEFPTCICKRVDRGDWCFGREAEYFAREHGAILVDRLYEICEEKNPVMVGQEELQPYELMSVFIGQVLKTLGSVDPIRYTKCLVITVEHLTQNMVRNLQKACEHLGFQEGHYLLQDYSESFFYYTLSQKMDYWNRNVAWFEFTPKSVQFRKLSVGMGAKPVLVTLSKPNETSLSEDLDLRDMEFYQFITRVMGSDVYSSIFITGQGFSQEWAVKSVPLLCKQNRKVFFGTNLFAKGACYTAKEKLEDRKLKGYLYAGDALVKMNIGMEMLVMGSRTYHPLISAGSNWYESSASCELILDRREDLVLSISSMETGEKKKVCMSLPGLPQRPNRTTRLLLELRYQSPKECRITVRDLGFGDMFPAQKKVWTETIKWEE